MRRLVLLDVNGVIGKKIAKSTIGIELSSYSFVLTPGVDKFLTELESHYSVGIFSSTTNRNLTKIIRALPTRFSLIMDRTMTDYDPDRNDFSTVKLLSRFWNSPVHNPTKEWKQENTLLVDDDINKTRFNDDTNVLIVDLSLHNLDQILEAIDEKFQSML
jgi:hypothetical protein